MPEKAGDIEAYSNPLAPDPSQQQDDDHHHLTNDDFRKLLMKPKSSSSGTSSKTPAEERPSSSSLTKHAALPEDDDDSAAAKRRKKKIYYAKLMKLKDEREKELALKYRDRATERRDGLNRDYEETEIISTTADYRAVAPDQKSGENYAERRRQVIQESKYLGGDMEHTHLVKGLDYALLEKVRAEITSKESVDDDEVLETAVTEKKPKEKEEEPEPQIDFKTRMGRNIFRIVFKNRPPERNELFLPGRMAYAVDLEDEFADSDVPTTVIRSKADCPSLESTTTLTTNDIVIGKLTQILSYLRQGRRDKKMMKKRDKGKPMKEDDKPEEKLPGADASIYTEADEVAPKPDKPRERRDRWDRPHDRGTGKDRDRDHDRGRDRHGDRGKDRRDKEKSDKDSKPARKSYFEKPAEEEEDKSKPAATAKDLVKNINERFKGYAELEDEKERVATKKEDDRMKKLKAKTEIDSYAECYPGMMESADAIDDSDDEVDYSKMDHGNKKGPVGRWDFDTQDEYNSYMSNKEATPKAAFQYGVKMADGRRTRRVDRPKDEKAELDREWQKIQNIIDKRKGPGPGNEGAKKSKH